MGILFLLGSFGERPHAEKDPSVARSLPWRSRDTFRAQSGVVVAPLGELWLFEFAKGVPGEYPTTLIGSEDSFWYRRERAYGLRVHTYCTSVLYFRTVLAVVVASRVLRSRKDSRRKANTDARTSRRAREGHLPLGKRAGSLDSSKPLRTHGTETYYISLDDNNGCSPGTISRARG